MIAVRYIAGKLKGRVIYVTQSKASELIENKIARYERIRRFY